MRRKESLAQPGPVSRRVARGLALLGVAALGVAVPSAVALAAAARPAAAHGQARGGREWYRAVTERGKIVGWRGGNAVVYPTAGFFGNPQILAVGAVRPDGRFAVQLPGQVPVDLLSKSTSQCATLRSSNPVALSTFTGDDLIYSDGVYIGNTHSGSTLGIAAFTSFANGDTRSGYVYADRDTKLTGFCERTIKFGGATVDFRQNFDLPLHKGWNRVAAYFSVPRPGHVVASLKLGTGRHEKWYFFAR